MNRLLIWLVWGVVIAGVCVAGDQLLLHSSLNSPVYGAAQTFYTDFRGRIISLVNKENHRRETIKESVPPPLLPVTSKKIKAPVLPEPEPSGYIYSDKAGGLHMTTRLDEVPREYRAAAKPLDK